MQRFLISGFAFAMTCVSAAQADPNNWPELFRTAVTPSEKASDYSFETTIVNSDFEEGQSLQYRTAKSGNDKAIELIALPADMKEEKILEQLSDGEGDIWCDDYRKYVSGNVALTSEDDATATYTFMLNPDTATDKTEKKIFKKTQMTVTVDKTEQWVKGFTYELLEPVKPMVVAKVREFSLNAECTRSENGRPHVSRMETRVSGTAMGSAFNQISTQTVSNVVLTK